MSKWGDPSYQGLADVGHFLAAYSVLITVGLFLFAFHRPWSYLLAVAGAETGYGIWKEFWFDLKYESPDVSGGIRGGIRDLAGYCLGAATALAVTRILTALSALA